MRDAPMPQVRREGVIDGPVQRTGEIEMPRVHGPSVARLVGRVRAEISVGLRIVTIELTLPHELGNR